MMEHGGGVAVERFGGVETKEAFEEEEQVWPPEHYQRTGQTYPPRYERYIRVLGPKKGVEMYKLMSRWRKEHDIDHLIERPYTDYWLIKEGTPHYLYGHSKTGSWVSYELNGRIDPVKLSKAGVRAVDIEKHIAFSHEFVREVLDHGEEKGYMVVMDMAGFSLFKATNFFFLTTLHKYYTGVLERLVVVNPPLGTRAIYTILMGVLPGVFKDKVVIKTDPSALLEWIDADQLPVEYGGTNTTPLSESDAEKAIRAHLERVNSSSK